MRFLIPKCYFGYNRILAWIFLHEILLGCFIIFHVTLPTGEPMDWTCFLWLWQPSQKNTIDSFCPVPLLSRAKPLRKKKKNAHVLLGVLKNPKDEGEDNDRHNSIENMIKCRSYKTNEWDGSACAHLQLTALCKVSGTNPYSCLLCVCLNKYWRGFRLRLLRFAYWSVLPSKTPSLSFRLFI